MALGTWIGGMTISQHRVLSTQDRNKITVATPGLNLQEAVEIYSDFIPIMNKFLGLQFRPILI
jgi:hypothetical protein